MSISKTLEMLGPQLSRHAKHYAEVRACRAELWPYESPQHVVAALDMSSSKSSDERYALVAALVAEHQRTGHPLWTSLLLIGFAPMLYRLRSLVARSDNDGDQRVLVAFVEAVSRIRLEKTGFFATIALRRATQGALFARRIPRPEEETVPFDEDEHTPCTPFLTSESELRAEEALARRNDARIEEERAALRRRVKPFPTRRFRAA